MSLLLFFLNTTWEYKFSNSLTRNYLFKGCKEFYASGDSGYFAKSTDCGETWTELPFNVLNPTSVNERTTIIDYSLEQNYPNPFNPSTKIKYAVPKQGLVSIRVYDILGKEVVHLVNKDMNAGEYEVDFNGSSLSSGIYFYQIQTGSYLETKKMLLIK
ncbi:MAG TPA: T9SS type A sorting domain-containing protein [Ignavibacteriaceae bacterium]|nr:T9SS type A sorting domain-containing protein [Ignavibacteriaceae bacterium]